MKKIELFAMATLLAVIVLYNNKPTLSSQLTTQQEIIIPEGFTSNAEEFSDTWCLELTKYNHPDWDTSKCEDYVFMSLENFDNKYNK